ncbi:MAG: ABC transporter permease [Acidobacteria bacterium]|nr:MAG: ABC transporter permease [Acidobacteriota bacterium]
MMTLVQDLKYGLRALSKNPGFAAVAIITLALGIGANSAVFSAIDAVLLRPLPFPDGDELMRLEQVNPRAKGQGTFVAPVRLEDWNRMNTTFQAIAGYYAEDESETSGALPEKLTRALVTPRFLQVLGVSPVLGRDFSSEEERFGGTSAVLISDRFWRRRFGADPNVVGKKLKFGAESDTVIGVMPASFLYPDRGVDLWSAVPMDAPYAQSRESTWFATIGRLKPGVAVAQALADLQRIQKQLGAEYPKTDRDLAVQVEPLKDTIVGSVRGTLWLLFGSVTLLVLIVCTNIAALLLARATRRHQEIAIRGALGASRRRIVVQLLTEAFLLAAAGAALGLVVAGSASEAFRALARTMPRLEEIRLDWRIVAYSLSCAVVVTFLCGLAPALLATRRTLSETLAQGGRAHVSGRSSMHWLLVGVQVALAVTLLDGAGLLLRSLQALGRVSPGFDPSHILTLHISGGWGETADYKKLTARVDRTLDELRHVPGVEATATSATLPGVPASYETELKLSPPPTGAERKIFAESRFVSRSYFSTMRIPLLAGELCRENAGPVGVLVNRSFAETYLPGSLPMVHHIEAPGRSFVPAGDIVGMVGDAREVGINHSPVPTAYWCISAPMPDPYYLIRTRGEPTAMAETLRLKIHEIEPSRAVFDVVSLEDQLGDAFAETRMRSMLLTLFALTAVSLACLGLYGTLTYFVTVRRREVGLRLALGAMPGEIVKRFLVQGLRVSILGSFAGLGLAAATARLLSGMLYGVSPFDMATLCAVILLVLAVATGSCLLPALRASRVEPMEVLREE